MDHQRVSEVSTKREAVSQDNDPQPNVILISVNPPRRASEVGDGVFDERALEATEL